MVPELVVQGVRECCTCQRLLSCIPTALKCGRIKPRYCLALQTNHVSISLTYLLFKSVILIFIATFCECTALLDSLGRNLSESMVFFFWIKVYKQRQSETFVLLVTITPYQVSVLPALPSLPAGGELINS